MLLLKGNIRSYPLYAIRTVHSSLNRASNSWVKQGAFGSAHLLAMGYQSFYVGNNSGFTKNVWLLVLDCSIIYYISCLCYYVDMFTRNWKTQLLIIFT